MLFNSLTFLVFFALVVATYWSLPSWPARKNLLLVASYVFYGAWHPPFALLLLGSSVLDFWIAGRLAASPRPRPRRAWLAASVITNLGVLGLFKYGDFLLENVRWLAAQAGIAYQPPQLGLLLPVGISFYTFQSMSYTLDVYRGTLPPTRSLRDFILSVSFFPQLVAGPILRAADFLPQLAQAPAPHAGRFGWGLLLLTLGLFEKTVLADTLLASAAEKVFAYPGPLASLDAWTGVLAFSGQIFFDFAGYSTCALGIALCLGFHLRDNFRFPYAAVGFSDFWRRWHISLSTFLRDYLYIPLGGNRAGAVRAAINLMLVMFIGGLWHGAAWTFVAWGVLHGSYLVLERILRALFGEARWAQTGGARLALSLATYGAICFAWVFFRAADFTTAARLVQAMVGLLPHGDAILPTREILQVALVTLGLFVAHRHLRDTTLEDVVSRLPRPALAGLWTLMLFAIILTQGNGHAFIYFQF